MAVVEVALVVVVRVVAEVVAAVVVVVVVVVVLALALVLVLIILLVAQSNSLISIARTRVSSGTSRQIGTGNTCTASDHLLISNKVFKFRLKAN